VSWIPQVDTLLYDGRLPFYSEVMNETWPADSVRDDLVEVLTADAPARVVARWLDAWHGPGTASEVATALLGGFDMQQALAAAEVPEGQLVRWRAQAGHPSELTLNVQPEGAGAVVTVTREVDRTTIGAPVVIEVDDRREVWKTPSGPGTHRLSLSQRPEHVAIDPDNLVLQTDHVSDRWPTRWTAVVSAFPYELVVNSGRLSAAADVALRRQYDTRWLFAAGVATSPEDIVRADVSVYRFLGPLQDRRRRPYLLWLSAGPALLDPAFRSTDQAKLAVGGSFGGAWDTRKDTIFPRRGHRLSTGVSGGWAPGSGLHWGSWVVTAKGLAPLGGRVAAAGKIIGGLAEGDVAHRLLQLGGSSGVQALPAGHTVGHVLIRGSSELRWHILRNASVPGPLLWLAHIQLSGGADAGVMKTYLSGQPTDTVAVGASAGIAFTGDVLGARPTLLGTWVGIPVLVTPASVFPDAPVQIYVRMTQAF
jgi:hypothetical protein